MGPFLRWCPLQKIEKGEPKGKLLCIVAPFWEPPKIDTPGCVDTARRTSQVARGSLSKEKGLATLENGKHKAPRQKCESGGNSSNNPLAFTGIVLCAPCELGGETNSLHGTSVSPINLRLRFTCVFALHDVKAPSLRRWLSACKGTCGATPGALYLACGFKVPVNKTVPSSVPAKTRICKWACLLLLGPPHKAVLPFVSL